MTSTPDPSPPARTSPIEALGALTSRIAGRLVPDPFVLAIVLTALALALAFFLGDAVVDKSPGDRLTALVVKGWAGGLFGKGGLQFAFQMVLVLVTGYAFATSPPIQRVIDALARVPRTSAQASALVALAACLAGYLHWGLGAVAGAMLAREIGRAWHDLRRSGDHPERTLHYPLLGAAAYSGLLVWHGGLSGSAPLTVANQDHFLIDKLGIIPVDQTLFAPLNLIITGVLITATVAAYYLLTPSPERATPYDPAVHGGASAPAQESATAPTDDTGPPQHPVIALLEHSPLIPALFGAMALGYLAYAAADGGYKALNLNTVNLTFFTLGLLLHGSPRAYVAAATEGARGSVGIILQFPLYFGILGLLKASGLVQQLSDLFVSVSSASTLPLFTYLSAGLVNLFVPSGGGQWAIQGPIMTDAAARLGASTPKVIIALSHGDAWTNMLQPFWALPLLGIMGLRARDIVGYTTLIFLIAGPLTLALLMLL